MDRCPSGLAPICRYRKQYHIVMSCLIWQSLFRSAIVVTLFAIMTNGCTTILLRMATSDGIGVGLHIANDYSLTYLG